MTIDYHQFLRDTKSGSLFQIVCAWLYDESPEKAGRVTLRKYHRNPVRKNPKTGMMIVSHWGTGRIIKTPTLIKQIESGKFKIEK